MNKTKADMMHVPEDRKGWFEEIEWRAVMQKKDL
jgi:hypothetical protein